MESVEGTSDVGEAVDPKRTYALIVGVERYRAGASWAVPGPASDADRFAQWLRQSRKVPAENLSLFVSPLEAADLSEWSQRAMKRATFGNLYDEITNPLSRKVGDLLFVFWAGHGVVTAEGTHRLYCEDATADDGRHLDLEDVRRFLRSHSVTAFAKQVFIVDACKNYFEHLDMPAHLPRNGLPVHHHGPRNEVEQFMLFGAKDGEVSEVTKRRSGLFAEAVLRELKKTPRAVWPPDMKAVTTRLQKRFAALRDAGQANQTPSYAVYRDWDGNRDVLLPTVVRTDLTAIPSDDLAALGNLPPGSRMSLRHNQDFVGRKSDLLALAATLKGAQTAAVAASTGIGGIGKTQLACEFVYRYGQYFEGGVFWLNFGDTGAVPGEIASCGGADCMNLSSLRPDFADLPLDTQAKLVLTTWQDERWRDGRPRLLVFDNCEDPALFEKWRPRGGPCSILVTSRRAEWETWLGIHSAPLNVLSRLESVELLRRHRSDLHVDDADLKAIADELGDLPLALHLAGSVLAQYREVITPATYLEQLHRSDLLESRWLRFSGMNPTGHEQDVARTFELSFERLSSNDETDVLAIALLARAAWFALGEPIPRNLLRDTLELPKDDPASPLRAEDALARLLALGLLERGAAGALRLHRLLVVFVRARIADPGAQSAVERTVLAKAVQCSDESDVSPLIALQPLLRSVTDAASEREDEQAARLCTVLGDHQRKLGGYLRAQACYERALAIRKKRLGEQHSDTVASLNNLGLVLKDQAKFIEAERYYQQALEINLAEGGEHSARTVASLTDIAFLLKDRGEPAQAQRYFERALAAIRALRGEQHSETAESLNNLGLLLKDQGEYVKAEQHFQQALKINLAAEGEHSKGTIDSLTNLGLLVKDQGRYSEAQQFLDRALKSTEAMVGERHPDTVACLTNLGFLFLDWGLREPMIWFGRPRVYPAHEAPRYLMRALTIQQQLYPEGHPRIADALDSLGNMSAQQGDFVSAQGYFEQTLTIRQQVLGQGHPDVARSQSNLGRVLAAQGNREEATTYLQQAVAAFERTLGQAHGSSDLARARQLLREVEHQISERERMSHIMDGMLG